MKKAKQPEEPAFKEWLAPTFEKIIVIGVGGTGSYLVNGLCKMIAGYKLPVDLVFVDPDVVEIKNIYRQNFMSWEVGDHKSEALAFRMNQVYGLAVEAFVGKGEDYLTKESYGSPFRRSKTLTVCCLDNFQARLNMQKVTPMLDSGNSMEHGQVIFGTSNDPKEIRKEVRNWKKSPNVAHLPSPALKTGMNDLLTGQTEQDVELGCADHPFAEQSVFINELAAQAMLVLLHQILIAGRVTTPAIYFDSKRGRMNPAKLSKNYLRF